MTPDIASPGHHIVGRGIALSSLGTFLEHIAHPGGPRILILEGESGIGKTTLWRRCLDLAVERDFRVVSSRPASSEARLSFVGLADLLQDMSDVLTTLPAPQRKALEVALLLAEPTGGAQDAQGVSTAVLTTLRAAAAGRPVLVALDDVEWLDTSTADAIGFAIRRLGDEPVGLLLAARDPGGSPLGLGRHVPDERVSRIALEPLSIDELRELIRLRLDTSLPSPTLARLHAISGGNPFYALEITRSELRGEARPTGAALPIPRTLREDLVRDRLGALSAKTREALLYASACARPTVAMLQAAMGGPNLSGQLSKAIDVGVVDIHGGQIRFTHPLYGSAIYADASREHRHRIHRRLAEVVNEAEERVRHLALAADGPDGDVASALENAANAASTRGAAVAAGELFELALSLTPPEDASDVLRRRLSAADHRLRAGDYARAVTILEQIASTAPDGPDRAEALTRLGQALRFRDERRASAAALEEALRHGGLTYSPGRIDAWRSWALATSGDLTGAERVAEEAVRLAEQGADHVALAEALSALATWRTWLGHGIPHDLVDRAIGLETSVGPPAAIDRWSFAADRPSFALAGLLAWSGELDEARRRCTSLMGDATRMGDEYAIGVLHGFLAHVELLAGNWQASLAHIERTLLLAPDPTRRLAARASVEACMGEVDAALADAQHALAASRRDASTLEEILALSALGFTELSRGDPAAANEYFARAWELHQRWRIGEPAMFPFVADYAEALVGLGRSEEAEAIVRWLEERGEARDRPWAISAGARCRAQLEATRGNFTEAFKALDRATHEHDRMSMPFDLARTLLSLGTIRRRAKQKRPARDAIEKALRLFQELGAPLWAEKARSELGRIGGRRAVVAELTAAEQRVADLAAAGRTNREIAETLFMSVRTVEGHLSHVYAKLGIRSRTELAVFHEPTEGPFRHS